MITFAIDIKNDRDGGFSQEFKCVANPNPPSQIERSLLADYLTPKGMEVFDGILKAKAKPQQQA